MVGRHADVGGTLVEQLEHGADARRGRRPPPGPSALRCGGRAVEVPEQLVGAVDEVDLHGRVPSLSPRPGAAWVGTAPMDGVAPRSRCRPAGWYVSTTIPSPTDCTLSRRSTGGVADLAEQPLAAPEDDREHHQPDSSTRSCSTSSWTSAALPATSRSPGDGRLEPVHLGDERRRARRCSSARWRRRPRSVDRDDELGHRVHLVGEAHGVLHGGPRRGKALVRHAAEQQGLGREHLVELVAVALGAPVEAKRPTGVTGPLGTPGSSITPSSETNSDTTILPMATS